MPARGVLRRDKRIQGVIVIPAGGIPRKWASGRELAAEIDIPHGSLSSVIRRIRATSNTGCKFKGGPCFKAFPDGVWFLVERVAQEAIPGAPADEEQGTAPERPIPDEYNQECAICVDDVDSRKAVTCLT